MSKNQLQAKNDKPPARCTNPGRTPQAPYQPFPALSDEEFAALKASIKAEGRVLHAIIKDEEGRILDGHHRWGAWEELRAEGCTIPEPRIEVVTGYTEARKRDLVLAVNLGRRHLGKEQRQYIIAHLRREGWSMRDIAEKARTSKSAVHRAISSGVPLGTPGDGSPPATVRGRDGRRYRARKKKRPMAAPATVLPGGSLAAFLAHTRQEITRRRKENHDERMRRNWNPEAIVRFQTELLDWIEEQLDLLAKAPHGGRNGDTSAKLSVTDAAPPADPVAPPPPPTKTKRQKQPIA